MADDTILNQQAGEVRLLLKMGLIAPEDVIAWADDWISVRDCLPGWVYDVSLAQAADPYQISQLLALAGNEINSKAAAIGAFQSFVSAYRHGDIETLPAATMLSLWASHPSLDDSERNKAMLPIWYAEEIEGGYMTIADVREQVEQSINNSFTALYSLQGGVHPAPNA
jgi:hypothetical protein